MKISRLSAVVFMVVSLLVCFADMSGATGEIDINSASKEELMQLEGIGSAYADRIIEHREANGPFETIEAIMEVKGIGTATFEKNKDRITVVEDGDGGDLQQ